MMSWPYVAALGLAYAWNVAVFGTTAYAVFWLGHSGWWFLLALCLGAYSTERDAQ